MTLEITIAIFKKVYAVASLLQYLSQQRYFVLCLILRSRIEKLIFRTIDLVLIIYQGAIHLQVIAWTESNPVKDTRQIIQNLIPNCNCNH